MLFGRHIFAYIELDWTGQLGRFPYQAFLPIWTADDAVEGSVPRLDRMLKKIEMPAGKPECLQICSFGSRTRGAGRHDLGKFPQKISITTGFVNL